MSQDYVLGFCFNDDLSCVVLMRKLKPEWQAGKLNGIGGKIECFETASEAMVREFKEETGVTTTEGDWKEFAQLRGNFGSVVCFFCISTKILESVETQEEEKLEVLLTGLIHHKASQMISNLPWLLWMCLDEDRSRMMADVEYA